MEIFCLPKHSWIPTPLVVSMECCIPLVHDPYFLDAHGGLSEPNSSVGKKGLCGFQLFVDIYEKI